MSGIILNIVGGTFGAKDPFFANVELLAINDNKGDTTTVFADESTTPKTLTTNGAAEYDTAYAPTGMTSSGLLATSTAFLTTPSNAGFNFGTDDMAFECWYYWPAVDPVGFAVFFDTGTQAFAAQLTSDKLALIFVINGGIKLTSSAHGMVSGNWYHLAWTRQSGVLYIFVDGVQKGTIADATSCATSGTVNLGRYSGGGYSIASNICCVRVTKGQARYTSSFTPPTLPLPTS